MSINAILIATDFSENARVAFEKGYELALQLGAKLHVLHVQDESSLRVAIREGLLDDQKTDEDLVKAVEALTAERFAILLATVDGASVTVDALLLRGDSGKVIAEYAGETSSGIIVMGRRGAGVMNDMMRAVVGSVAESVIRRSPCPVLLVKPDHK